MLKEEEEVEVEGGAFDKGSGCVQPASLSLYRGVISIGLRCT